MTYRDFQSGKDPKIVNENNVNFFFERLKNLFTISDVKSEVYI